MRTLSLNIKKIALSLLVVGLAIGSQAFKNAEKMNKISRDSQIVRYYKTNTSTLASDSTSYVYYTANRCQSGGSLCSALWDITDSNPAPADGASLPSGATYIGSVTPGHFQ